jgi:hypothetical protein
MAPQARREMLDGPRSTFQVGETLAKTFSIWLANLVPFAIMSLILFSPLYLWTYATAQHATLTEKEALNWSMGFTLGELVLAQVLAGAVTYGVIQQLRGQKADLGSCIRTGFSRLFPVLGVALLSYLLIGLGAIALLVGAVVVAVMLSVAVPVAVIEKPGITASLGRSRQLTRGSRGPVFVVILVLAIFGFAVDFLLRRALGGGEIDLVHRNYLWATLVVSTLVMGPLSAVSYTVIYHELRRSHEGASVEDIAKVFD